MNMFGKEKATLRKSNEFEQMALAKLFDGTFPELPGGSPSDVEAHPVYAPFAGSDALEVLVAKNVLASFGAEGYAHGWKWDSYVNATFTENEKPPAPK